MPSKRCGAKTRQGRQCTQWAVAGAQRCRMHGGKTPQAAARAEAERIRRTLGDVPADVDPAQALLELVRMKWAEVQWLRSKVIEIGETPAGVDPDNPGAGAQSSPQLTYGLTKHDVGTGPQGPVDQMTFEVAPNIWWRLLREAEDQLAKYSALALKAGVEKRQIELQEAQAVHLATAINRILDALQLTAEQARKVPEIVPAVLRALPIGEK